MKNSPTFVFDGIDETPELTNTAAYSEKAISEDNIYGDEIDGVVFTFIFDSSSAGYGDKSDQVVVRSSHSMRQLSLCNMGR